MLRPCIEGGKENINNDIVKLFLQPNSDRTFREVYVHCTIGCPTKIVTL